MYRKRIPNNIDFSANMSKTIAWLWWRVDFWIFRFPNERTQWQAMISFTDDVPNILEHVLSDSWIKIVVRHCEKNYGFVPAEQWTSSFLNYDCDKRSSRADKTTSTSSPVLFIVFIYKTNALYKSIKQARCSNELCTSRVK